VKLRLKLQRIIARGQQHAQIPLGSHQFGLGLRQHCLSRLHPKIQRALRVPTLSDVRSSPQLRLRQLCLRHLYTLLGQAHLRARSVDLGVEGKRVADHLLRQNSGLSRTIALGLGLGQRRLRGSDLLRTRPRLHARQIGLSRRQSGLSLQSLALKHLAIQTHQHITRRDSISAVNQHLGDAPRYLRSDNHLLALDEAGGDDGTIVLAIATASEKRSQHYAPHQELEI
jgi:hypothetical protein